VLDASIYCIKVEQEVGYCEFVYAVSAIFLLPVFACALFGVFCRLFRNLLRQISRLSTVTVSFDVKRRSATATLFSGFGETGSSF